MTHANLVYGGRADAYLEWALLTKFSHVHKLPHPAHGRQVGLVVEDGAPGSLIRTVLVETDSLATNPAYPSANRIELAAAVAADRHPITSSFMPPPGKVQEVIGLIDDGCPFAQAAFADPSSGGRSRVKLLWDQGAPHDAGSGRYGRVFSCVELDKPKAGDDVGHYQSLGFSNLRRRATHGAHVMDLMAGPVHPRSRVSPSRMREQAGDGSAVEAPTWARLGDAASRAPIFFVQLPKDAIEDPTGRWLPRYVLDGLDFLIEQAQRLWPPTSPLPSEKQTQPAEPPERKRLVVNISWGPQTGPHDGSTLLEKAFEQRIAKFNQADRELIIVLPAGNSYESRAHAQFELRAGCPSLHWQTMPDAGTPQFLEIWWPAGTHARHARFQVTAPDGERLEWPLPNKPTEGSFMSPGAGWIVTVVPHNDRFMALLALAPTRSGPDHASPPHGGWKIEVPAIVNSRVGKALVHVYVARNSANLGAGRRSKDAYLHDPVYETSRHGPPPRREPVESKVRREGTLTGIATGASVKVAGAYVLSRKKPPDPNRDPEQAASYSSSGPGAGRDRRNPDWALPGDESPFLPGLLASGVRDGTAVRMVGTSVAAPQLARKYINREDPVVAPSQPPVNTPNVGPGQRNRGEPPPEPRPAPAPAPVDSRLGRGAVPMKKDYSLE